MRPVGNRIRQVMEIVDKHPGMVYSQIADELGIEPSNAYKYCQRAIEMQMLEADYTHKPAKYWPVDNWRGILDELDWLARPKLQAAIEARKLVVSSASGGFVNSVWALA